MTHDLWQMISYETKGYDIISYHVIAQGYDVITSYHIISFHDIPIHFLTRHLIRTQHTY